MKIWAKRIGLVVLFITLYFFVNMIGSITANAIREVFGVGENDRGVQIGLFMNIFTVIYILLFSKYVLKLDAAKLWLKKKGSEKNYLKGYVVGAAMFCAFMAISLIFNNTVFEGRGSLGIINTLLYIPAYAVQSFEEELLSRGLFQRVVKDKFGVIASMLLPSIFFMALHLGNSGITLVAIVNLIVVGVLFSLMVYATGSLWYAAAAHAAWNYFQGSIFGMSVSGNDFGGSLLKFKIIGENELLTGGKFGPEGTVVVVFILIATSIYYYYKIRRNSGSLSNCS